MTKQTPFLDYWRRLCEALRQDGQLPIDIESARELFDADCTLDESLNILGAPAPGPISYAELWR